MRLSTSAHEEPRQAKGLNPLSPSPKCKPPNVRDVFPCRTHGDNPSMKKLFCNCTPAILSGFAGNVYVNSECLAPWEQNNKTKEDRNDTDRNHLDQDVTTIPAGSSQCHPATSLLQNPASVPTFRPGSWCGRMNRFLAAVLTFDTGAGLLAGGLLGTG